MADIKKELNDIKNAIYGRDVRGSIHDGIDKINKESEVSKQKANEAHDVMESIINDGFDNAALEANFEQKLDDEIGRLQPEWTQFKNDTQQNFNDVTSQLNETVKKNIFSVNVKDFGAIGDGITDDTETINNAITYAHENGIEEVYVPKGVYMIKAHDGETIVYGLRGGIALKDNIKLRLDVNTILKAIPNDNEGYNIIRARNVENIKIIGGTIEGERNEHTGTTGEWGHGINIRDCTNVYINTKVINCWGDGIFLGGGSNPTINAIVENTICDNNRRQGMSVVNVENIKVYNSVFSNTNGTYPEAGIDLEPSNLNESVINVVIKDCYFEGNMKTGLLSHGKFGRIEDIFVANCVFKNNESGVRLEEEYTKNIHLLNNKVYGSTFRGLTVSHNASNITIDGLTTIGENNQFRVDAGYNLVLRNSNVASVSIGSGVHHVDIINVTIYGVEGESYGTYNDNSEHIRYIDCKFIGKTRFGLRFTDSSFIAIEGCLFEGMTEYAIRVNASNSIIKNNKFVDIGGIDSENVIFLDGFSHRNNISDNIARTRKSDKATYGIRLSTLSQFNYIVNNDFYGSYSDDVVLSNEHINNIVESNR